MGNVYPVAECEHCKKVVSADTYLIVHREHNLQRLISMVDAGIPFHEAILEFCQYCGGHKSEMNCGNEAHPSP